jgi:diadenosine tetraphosphatase ApaH/serine/threonine PP2A family protein phosphatase
MAFPPFLNAVDVIFASFETILMCDEDPVQSIGAEIPIPVFSEAAIADFLPLVKARFQSQDALLRVPAPVIIAGDIHGNLQDLLRILREFGLGATFLFLGDYVDRGQFSLECILFLFALTCKFPERFFLLRGNHECRAVASKYGFQADILALYSEGLFAQFVDVFEWMPIGAIAADTIFCVHGGIGPSVHKLSQIADLIRPLDESPLLRQLLWADPNPSFQTFNDGDRGKNVEFGPLALAKFLQANKLAFLVRGHQCVDGVEFIPGMDIATVFSSSNYKPDRANLAGVLAVDADGQKRHIIWPDTVTIMLRTGAMFCRVADHADKLPGKLMLHSPVHSSGSLLPSLSSRRRNVTSTRLLPAPQGKRLVVPKVQTPNLVF